MAGCVVENENQLYEQSETLEVAKLISSGLGEDAAKKQGHETMLHHRKVDDEYKKQDVEGQEGVGAEFTFTSDGDVYFPEYGGYLGELYKNQKKARPREYVPKEHGTVIEAYRMLKNGATQAAHIVHHYDENGQPDVRDVVVLTFDHTTNRGTMHILNISEDGENHHSLESAYEAMKTRLNGFGKEVMKDDAYLLVRNESPVDPVSLFREKLLIVQEKAVIPSDKYEREPVEVYKPTLRFQEPSPVIRNIPVHIPVYLQKLLGRDEKGMPVKTAAEKQVQKRVRIQSSPDTIFLYRQSEGEKEKKTTPPSNNPSYASKAVEKSSAPFPKDKKTGNTVSSQILFDRKRAVQTEIVQQDEEKTPVRKKIHTEEHKNLGHRIIKKETIVKLKKEHRIYQKEKRIKKSEKRRILIFEQFRKITLGLERQKRKIKIRNRWMGSAEQMRQRNDSKAVFRFTQAFLLFTLFSFERKADQHKIPFVERKKETYEIHHELHETPWVLLSIIWHMTMIREQGVVQYQPKKKKKKAHDTKKRAGIIFDRSYLTAKPLIIVL